MTATIYRQLTSEDADVSISGFDLSLTHFLTDHFSATGAFGIGTIDTPLGDADVRSFSIGAEAQIPHAPLTIFGAYAYTDIEDLDLKTLQLGMRYNWGGSLFARDRQGANTRNAAAPLFPGLTF
ncbi:MAG TPA: hypothetical protein PKY87_07185 [Terricaulis sp.]|nr:hypothetical protein [Terricaulis sp.]